VPHPESTWLTLALTLGLAILLSLWFGNPGLVYGGLLGYLFAQRFHLARRIEALRERIDELEAAAVTPPVAPPAAPRAAPPETVPPPPVATAGLRIPTPEPIRPTAPPPPPAAPATATATPSVAQRPSPWPPAAAPEAAGLDALLARGLGWLKGGNPLARVGIVVLFFGGAFLAKYAVDHSLLPLELRLAGLGAGALALLGLGWRLRASRRVYAQILQGGGIAGLYLTVFAATRLYHLLPHGFALPLLIVIAAAAAVLAVAQSALPLAVIGTAGGFLAPVLLSTGGGSHVALFTYYAILNLGVFTVAWFRAWRVLNLVGFAFTFAITGAWRAYAYQPAQLVTADGFLLLFFAMYVAISILFALRQKPDLRGYVSGSLVFGLPVVVTSLHGTMIARIEYGLAFSALGFGAFYLALAWALFATRRDTLRLLAEAFAALGVVFGSLAIPLAFDAKTTTAMWAVEGAGLLWLGIRQQRRLARAFGALLQLAGGVGYLWNLAPTAAATPLLNSACIGTVLLAVAGILCARWLHRAHAQAASYERGGETLAALWASAWWWYGGIAEVLRSAPASAVYGMTLAFAAGALVITDALGRRWEWPLLSRLALVQLPASVLAGLAWAMREAHPFAEFGWAGWLLLVAAGYWLLYRFDGTPDEGVAPLLPWLHGAAAWLLALLGAWELHWQIAQAVPGVWRALPAGLAPAALIWLAEAPRPRWPLAAHRVAYRVQGALPLAAAATLWLLGVNLGQSGDPGWLPYWPLLNPLDIASLLVLLTLAHVWLEPAPAVAWPDRRSGWIALAAVTFVWLNSALIRGLHHGFDTPLDLHGIRHSVLVQGSLSIFWSLLGIAAMTLAAKRASRAVWIVGAGLMGVVVLKLFLVDLEGTGTLWRIVSFLSVGVVLLAAGYLSPLPPSSATKAPS
jgi:uncharacterized membrane protein